ncbi:General transcription factor 3C polypeptide 1 [Lucilia cuprina]|nr:General transcription factor 3C polypeptide 1 [Lucilia cuprina]
MNISNRGSLQRVILDEIALEGLEGITLESLWVYLSKSLNLTQPITNQLKENVWNFILQVRQHLQFFELPEERSTVKLFDRYQFVDSDLGVPLSPHANHHEFSFKKHVLLIPIMLRQPHHIWADIRPYNAFNERIMPAITFPSSEWWKSPIRPLNLSAHVRDHPPPLLFSYQRQGCDTVNNVSYSLVSERASSSSFIRHGGFCHHRAAFPRTTTHISLPSVDTHRLCGHSRYCPVNQTARSLRADEEGAPLAPKNLRQGTRHRASTLKREKHGLPQESERQRRIGASSARSCSIRPHPITNTHTPEITPLPSTSSNVSTNMNASNQPINPFSAVSTPKPLKTIPPKKTIFATRFALDTTVNDVDYHIKSNLGMEFYNDVPDCS